MRKINLLFSLLFLTSFLNYSADAQNTIKISNSKAKIHNHVY